MKRFATATAAALITLGLLAQGAPASTQSTPNQNTKTAAAAQKKQHKKEAMAKRGAGKKTLPAPRTTPPSTPPANPAPTR
jgi:hypothetical protein